MRTLGLGVAFAIAVGAGVALGTLGDRDPDRTVARTATPSTEAAPEENTERPATRRRARDDEAALEQARSDVELELFSTGWCPHYADARAFLRRRGIRYREYDVEADREAHARMRTLHPSGGVPFLLLDGTDQVTGFSEGAYVAAIERAARRRVMRGR